MSKKRRFDDDAHKTRYYDLFIEADVIESLSSRASTSRLQASCLELSRVCNKQYWNELLEPLEPLLNKMIRHPSILINLEEVLHRSVASSG